MSIEKILDKDADLSKYPPVNLDNLSDTRSRVLGDLHANAGLMLYFWVREGIASIDEEDYLQIQEVYHTPVATGNAIFIPTADASEIITNYQNLLKKVKFNHPVKKIHFVGDTLADRSMSGDQYVLFNYEALDKNNVPFDVCLSNHDLEFITAYWQDKRKFSNVDDRKLESIYNSGINQGGQVNSTNVLSALLNKNVITPQRVNDLVENHYLPHVKLFSYTVTSDSLALITHAPIDFGLIRCAAEALGVPYQDKTPAALALTIDNINDQFKERYIQTGDIIELSPSTSMDGYFSSGITGYKSIDSQSIRELDSDKQLRYILAALTWNRPISNEALNRPANHDRGGYSLQYVHGHTPTTNDPEHVTNLDSVFGKNKGFYTKEGQQTQGGRYNIGYRTIALPSLPEPVEALQVLPDLASSSVSVKAQQASLEDVVRICQELVNRYQEKMHSAQKIKIKLIIIRLRSMLLMIC